MRIINPRNQKREISQLNLTAIATRWGQYNNIAGTKCCRRHIPLQKTIFLDCPQTTR